MSDVEKGLPVRTEDDVDQKVQVKIVDSTTPAQQAEVDTDGNLHVQVMGDRCDDGAEIALRLSEQGSPNGRGDFQVDDNSCPDSSGVVAGIRSANNLATDQTEHITSVESGDTLTRALDLSLHDEDGEPYGPSNPLHTTSDASGGTPVQNFDQAVAVAADGGTSDHSLSVANGVTFLLQQIIASASSRFKITVDIGDGGVSEIFTSKAVKFGSEATHSAEIIFAQPIEVIGTVNTTTVKVIRENRDDDDAQDIYTTIVGVNL